MTDPIAAAEGETKSACVMIVEDDAQLRGVMRMLLEEDPRIEVVQELPTGGQAVAFALSHDIDLVVLDHHLVDGASGIEAAEELRRARPGIRIVLCSADVEVNDLAPPGVVDALVSKQQLIQLLTITQDLLGITP